MTDKFNIPFSGGTMDHAETQRSNEDIATHLANPKSKVLLFRNSGVAMKEDGWLLTVHPEKLIGRNLYDPGPLFLGLKDDTPYFVAGMESGGDLVIEDQFMDMRVAAQRLHPEELAIAGRGKSLLEWHQSHRFCAQCGKPSSPGLGGIVRSCEPCQIQHFPRVNPVAIMMVMHEDHCLLGRAANWPKGAYSALAGFVSPGETIEETCIREVHEEVGVSVTNVKYIMSQPWPFPSQLMIGLTCEATNRALVINKAEIEDAKWFSRETVEGVFAKQDDSFLRPPRMAVAHHLIKHWLNS